MFNARNRIAMGDGRFTLPAGTQSLDFIGSPESRVRTLRTGGLTYDFSNSQDVDSWFQGREINALRFWSVARTEAQINSHRDLILAPYSAEPGDQQGLVGYYRFDDGVNELATQNQTITDFLDYAPILLGASINIQQEFDPLLTKTVCSDINPNARVAFEEKPILPTESTFKQSLVCQPNPFSNTLFVQFSSPVSGFFNLKIRDLNGKLVFEQTMLPVNNKVELNRMPIGLPKGMYTIEATHAGKVLRSKVAHQ